MLNILLLFSLVGFNLANLSFDQFRIIAPTANPRAFTCPRPGLVCSSDCQTLALCTGTNVQPYWSQSCASENPNTPYCVGSRCTATPDLNQTSCVSPFICTGAGQFPDPNDCSAYQTCSSANAQAVQTKCPYGQVYQSIRKSCRRQFLTSYCEKFDCSKAISGVTVFSRDPAYYAFCLTGNGIPQTIVFKCPDEVSEIYDVQQGQCRYNCRIPGNFVDRSDCNSYIQCRRVGRSWEVNKIRCPDGYWFHIGLCLREWVKCQSISPTTTTQTPQTTTTQISTTEQSTTQQSTTEQSTTQQSTTEQSTTQQSTTEQSTTQQSTTEPSTTQQSTTQQQTTQQSTTQQETTQQSTTNTQQPTTQESTTEQQSTTQ